MKKTLEVSRLFIYQAEREWDRNNLMSLWTIIPSSHNRIYVWLLSRWMYAIVLEFEHAFADIFNLFMACGRLKLEQHNVNYAHFRRFSFSLQFGVKRSFSVPLVSESIWYEDRIQ